MRSVILTVTIHRKWEVVFCCIKLHILMVSEITFLHKKSCDQEVANVNPKIISLVSGSDVHNRVLGMVFCFCTCPLEFV